MQVKLTGAGWSKAQAAPRLGVKELVTVTGQDHIHMYKDPIHDAMQKNFQMLSLNDMEF